MRKFVTRKNKKRCIAVCIRVFRDTFHTSICSRMKKKKKTIIKETIRDETRASMVNEMHKQHKYICNFNIVVPAGIRGIDRVGILELNK